MADPGITNPAFEHEDISESLSYGPLEPSTRWRDDVLSTPTSRGVPLSMEMQSIRSKQNTKHRKSASVGTPLEWSGQDNTPAKVLRAWTKAQINLEWQSSSESEDDKGFSKTRGIQTDEPFATLSSWKILRTRPSSVDRDQQEKDLTLKHEVGCSSNTDFVVVETRSLGFEASTQTKDAFLFRYSDTEAFEMVMAWRMVTIFLPITWYMIMYVADQATDVFVTAGFCCNGQPWWCGISLVFLIVPHLAINAYAYEQLVRPDIASVVPVNKWFARALAITQLAPHYIIARKWSWCYRAWRKVSWKHQTRKRKKKKDDHQTSMASSPSTTPNGTVGISIDPDETKPQKHRKSAKILWEQAKAETYSETVKLYQSLFISAPQLAIQTYVLMVLWQKDEHDAYVEPVLISSVFISLTSASSGLASVLADNSWEKVAASTAIFLTLGCRVMVSGAIGSIKSAYWFIPVSSSVFVGVVTKIFESKDTEVVPILVKMHKYLSEAVVMATVCPPFNALGVFTSVPYVIAGLVFLLRNPSQAINIITFIFSLFGQVAWLAVGFFVT